MGKHNFSCSHLSFVPYHNVSYKHRLGIVVVLASRRGVQPVWYFSVLEPHFEGFFFTNGNNATIHSK